VHKLSTTMSGMSLSPPTTPPYLKSPPPTCIPCNSSPKDVPPKKGPPPPSPPNPCPPNPHTCIDPDYDGLICDPCIAEQKAEDDEIAAQVAAWSKRMKCNILLRRKRPAMQMMKGKVALGVSVTEFTTCRKWLCSPHFDPKTRGNEHSF